MKGLTSLYGNERVSSANASRRNAIIVFIIVSILFVALCVGIVLLYIKISKNVFVFFIINTLVTIAFSWFGVIFFTDILPEKQAKRGFFEAIKNSSKTPFRCVYVASNGEKTQDGMRWNELVFKTDESFVNLLVLSDIDIPFKKDDRYDILSMGNKITDWAVAK